MKRLLTCSILIALLVLLSNPIQAQTWTAQTSAADNQWNDIVYSSEKSLFVAVSRDGTNRVMTSSDGITWTARTAPASTWQSVTYASWSASVNNKALTSNVATLTTSAAHNFSVGMSVTVTGVDAKFNGTYTITGVPSTTTFTYAKTAGNVSSAAVSPVGTASAGWFVAVGTGCVMTSPDGITWTARTPAAANGAYNGIAYGNGIFVASNTNTGAGSDFMTSPNGVTWTSLVPPVKSSWRGLTFGNGLFVSVAASASKDSFTVMTSNNGSTWTVRTGAVNNSWYSVVYGNGLFVAVSITGTGNRVMTSPDGISWTSRTSAADNQWYDVTLGDGRFIAVAQSGTGNRVMTSEDGINWSTETSAVDNNWRGVAYGKGCFAAVANTGTGNRVMTRSENMYLGSSGDGAALAISPLSNSNGQSLVIWRGGASGATTDWASAANWVGGVPTSTDIVFVEPNGNGFQPVLDANRSIGSLNFNGAMKKVALGPYQLTLSDTVYRSDAANYFQTNNTGSLKLAIPSNKGFTFPVGNSSYNPVTITNNTGTADDFSVRVADEVLIGGTGGNPINLPLVNRTWHIGKTNGSANAGNGVDFVFQWNPAEETGGISTFALNHHNDTAWAFATATGSQTTSGTNLKTLTFTGYKGTFSPFSIGGDASPLPVKLLYFTAECKPQGSTLLGWATASEINSAYFELQRSDDMLHWSLLETIPALGYHSSTYHYPKVLDSEPGKATRYYRLKQVDYNGEHEYFNAIAARCPVSTTTITLYPNPTAEQLNIQGAQVGESWEILNMTGLQIRTGTIKEESLQSISILDLPAGLYRINLPTTSLQFIKK
jgi:hypothetical protein